MAYNLHNLFLIILFKLKKRLIFHFSVTMFKYHNIFPRDSLHFTIATRLQLLFSFNELAMDILSKKRSFKMLHRWQTTRKAPDKCSFEIIPLIA